MGILILSFRSGAHTRIGPPFPADLVGAPAKLRGGLRRKATYKQHQRALSIAFGRITLLAISKDMYY